MDRLLTPTEAATLLRIRPRTMIWWLQAGKFPGVRVGRLWRVREVDIEEYVETHMQGISQDPKGGSSE